jgi:pimeloyl-ACP methyl ester carboxylesterase
MMPADLRDDVPTTRLRVPKWLAAVAGAVGTILGLATNLYSSEFREALSASSAFASGALSVVIATVVASGTTALLYRWLSRRSLKQRIPQLEEIKIDPSILSTVSSEQDTVVGRSLRYLEIKRDSPELVIFLHGLGLDANDFRPYMIESKFHCVALTLYGFNADEKDNALYRPISLESHVQLLGYALEKLKDANPRKRITLVGFSFGADMIFFLSEYSSATLRRLNVHRAVLLDPNINQRTTTISSKIANVDEKWPLEDLVKILESATDMAEFRNLCEYLYKITSKNFGQIQGHARDVIEMWPGVEYQKFLDRTSRLIQTIGGVRIVLSVNYEQHFNAIAHAARARGIESSCLDIARNYHFDLIETRFLEELLEGLL